MDSWRQRTRTLVDKIHAVDPHYVPPTETVVRAPGLVSYADIAAGRSRSNSRCNSPFKTPREEPPPSSLTTQVLRKTASKTSAYQMATNESQSEDPLTDKRERTPAGVPKVASEKDSSRKVDQTRRGRSPTRKAPPKPRKHETRTETPIQIKVSLTEESAPETTEVKMLMSSLAPQERSRGRSPSPMWIPGSTSYADILRGRLQGNLSRASSEPKEMVQLGGGPNIFKESSQVESSQEIQGSVTIEVVDTTTNDDVPDSQVRVVDQEVPYQNICQIRESNDGQKNAINCQEEPKDWSTETASTDWSAEPYEAPTASQTEIYDYMHPTPELVGFINSQMGTYPVSSYVYAPTHQQVQGLDPRILGSFEGPSSYSEDHYVTQGNYLPTAELYPPVQASIAQQQLDPMGEFMQQSIFLPQTVADLSIQPQMTSSIIMSEESEPAIQITEASVCEEQGNVVLPKKEEFEPDITEIVIQEEQVLEKQDVIDNMENRGPSISYAKILSQGLSTRQTPPPSSIPTTTRSKESSSSREMTPQESIVLTKNTTEPVSFSSTQQVKGNGWDTMKKRDVRKKPQEEKQKQEFEKKSKNVDKVSKDKAVEKNITSKQLPEKSGVQKNQKTQEIKKKQESIKRVEESKRESKKEEKELKTENKIEKKKEEKDIQAKEVVKQEDKIKKEEIKVIKEEIKGATIEKDKETDEDSKYKESEKKRKQKKKKAVKSNIDEIDKALKEIENMDKQKMKSKKDQVNIKGDKGEKIDITDDKSVGSREKSDKPLPIEEKIVKEESKIKLDRVEPIKPDSKKIKGGEKSEKKNKSEKKTESGKVSKGEVDLAEPIKQENKKVHESNKKSNKSITSDEKSIVQENKTDYKNKDEKAKVSEEKMAVKVSSEDSKIETLESIKHETEIIIDVDDRSTKSNDESVKPVLPKGETKKGKEEIKTKVFKKDIEKTVKETGQLKKSKEKEKGKGTTVILVEESKIKDQTIQFSKSPIEGIIETVAEKEAILTVEDPIVDPPNKTEDVVLIKHEKYVAPLVEVVITKSEDNSSKETIQSTVVTDGRKENTIEVTKSEIEASSKDKKSAKTKQRKGPSGQKSAEESKIKKDKEVDVLKCTKSTNDTKKSEAQVQKTSGPLEDNKPPTKAVIEKSGEEISLETVSIIPSEEKMEKKIAKSDSNDFKVKEIEEEEKSRRKGKSLIDENLTEISEKTSTGKALIIEKAVTTITTTSTGSEELQPPAVKSIEILENVPLPETKGSKGEEVISLRPGNVEASIVTTYARVASESINESKASETVDQGAKIGEANMSSSNVTAPTNFVLEIDEEHLFGSVKDRKKVHSTCIPKSEKSLELIENERETKSTAVFVTSVSNGTQESIETTTQAIITEIIEPKGIDKTKTKEEHQTEEKEKEKPEKILNQEEEKAMVTDIKEKKSNAVKANLKYIQESIKPYWFDYHAYAQAEVVLHRYYTLQKVIEKPHPPVSSEPRSSSIERIVQESKMKTPEVESSKIKSKSGAEMKSAALALEIPKYSLAEINAAEIQQATVVQKEKVLSEPSSNISVTPEQTIIIKNDMETCLVEKDKESETSKDKISEIILDKPIDNQKAVHLTSDDSWMDVLDDDSLMIEDDGFDDIENQEPQLVLNVQSSMIKDDIKIEKLGVIMKDESEKEEQSKSEPKETKAHKKNEMSNKKEKSNEKRVNKEVSEGQKQLKEQEISKVTEGKVSNKQEVAEEQQNLIEKKVCKREDAPIKKEIVEAKIEPKRKKESKEVPAEESKEKQSPKEKVVPVKQEKLQEQAVIQKTKKVQEFLKEKEVPTKVIDTKEQKVEKGDAPKKTVVYKQKEVAKDLEENEKLKKVLEEKIMPENQKVHAQEDTFKKDQKVVIKKEEKETIEKDKLSKETEALKVMNPKKEATPNEEKGPEEKEASTARKASTEKEISKTKELSEEKEKTKVKQVPKEIVKDAISEKDQFKQEKASQETEKSNVKETRKGKKPSKKEITQTVEPKTEIEKNIFKGIKMPEAKDIPIKKEKSEEKTKEQHTKSDHEKVTKVEESPIVRGGQSNENQNTNLESIKNESSKETELSKERVSLHTEKPLSVHLVSDDAWLDILNDDLIVIEDDGFDDSENNVLKPTTKQANVKNKVDESKSITSKDKKVKGKDKKYDHETEKEPSKKEKASKSEDKKEDKFEQPTKKSDKIDSLPEISTEQIMESIKVKGVQKLDSIKSVGDKSVEEPSKIYKEEISKDLNGKISDVPKNEPENTSIVTSETAFETTSENTETIATQAASETSEQSSSKLSKKKSKHKKVGKQKDMNESTKIEQPSEISITNLSVSSKQELDVKESKDLLKDNITTESTLKTVELTPDIPKEKSLIEDKKGKGKKQSQKSEIKELGKHIEEVPKTDNTISTIEKKPLVRQLNPTAKSGPKHKEMPDKPITEKTPEIKISVSKETIVMDPNKSYAEVTATSATSSPQPGQEEGDILKPEAIKAVKMPSKESDKEITNISLLSNITQEPYVASEAQKEADQSKKQDDKKQLEQSLGQNENKSSVVENVSSIKTVESNTLWADEVEVELPTTNKSALTIAENVPKLDNSSWAAIAAKKARDAQDAIERNEVPIPTPAQRSVPQIQIFVQEAPEVEPIENLVQVDDQGFMEFVNRKELRSRRSRSRSRNRSQTRDNSAVKNPEIVETRSNNEKELVDILKKSEEIGSDSKKRKSKKSKAEENKNNNNKENKKGSEVQKKDPQILEKESEAQKKGLEVEKKDPEIQELNKFSPAVEVTTSVVGMVEKSETNTGIQKSNESNKSKSKSKSKKGKTESERAVIIESEVIQDIKKDEEIKKLENVKSKEEQILKVNETEVRGKEKVKSKEELESKFDQIMEERTEDKSVATTKDTKNFYENPTSRTEDSNKIEKLEVSRKETEAEKKKKKQNKSGHQKEQVQPQIQILKTEDKVDLNKSAESKNTKHEILDSEKLNIQEIETIKIQNEKTISSDELKKEIDVTKPLKDEEFPKIEELEKVEISQEQEMPINKKKQKSKSKKSKQDISSEKERQNQIIDQTDKGVFVTNTSESMQKSENPTTTIQKPFSEDSLICKTAVLVTKVDDMIKESKQTFLREKKTESQSSDSKDSSKTRESKKDEPMKAIMPLKKLALTQGETKIQSKNESGQPISEKSNKVVTAINTKSEFIAEKNVIKHKKVNGSALSVDQISGVSTPELKPVSETINSETFKSSLPETSVISDKSSAIKIPAFDESAVVKSPVFEKQETIKPTLPGKSDIVKSDVLIKPDSDKESLAVKLDEADKNLISEFDVPKEPNVPKTEPTSKAETRFQTIMKGPDSPKVNESKKVSFCDINHMPPKAVSLPAIYSDSMDSLDGQPKSKVQFYIADEILVIPQHKEKDPKMEEKIAKLVQESHVPGTIWPKYASQDGGFWVDKRSYHEAERDLFEAIASRSKQQTLIATVDQNPPNDDDSNDGYSGGGGRGSNAKTSSQFSVPHTERLVADLPGGICSWSDYSTYLSPESIDDQDDRKLDLLLDRMTEDLVTDVEFPKIEFSSVESTLIDTSIPDPSSHESPTDPESYPNSQLNLGKERSGSNQQPSSLEAEKDMMAMKTQVKSIQRIKVRLTRQKMLGLVIYYILNAVLNSYHSHYIVVLLVGCFFSLFVSGSITISSIFFLPPDIGALLLLELGALASMTLVLHTTCMLHNLEFFLFSKSLHTPITIEMFVTLSVPML